MEDEDDTHFCIRCKRSIQGLDNYVNHRKQTCVKIQNVNSKQANPESGGRPESGKPCSGSSEVELATQKQSSWSESLDKNFRQSGSSDVLGPFMPSTGFLEPERENVNRYGAFESDVKSVTDREHGVTNRIAAFSDHTKTFGKDEKDYVTGTSSIVAPSDHFPRFDEPLFHNDPAVSSFFKSFDSFVDGRFQSLTDHQMLFPHKEATDSYESAGHDVEQRYSDLYGGFGGHSSQDIEQNVKGSKCLAVNRASKDSTDPDEVKTIEIQDNASIPGLHVDLKQDDFLSSLDLSSVKLLHDKRKYSFEDEEEDDEDEDQHRPPTHHTGGKWRPGMAPPPSTVAGKWRPFSPTSQDRTDYDDEGDSSVSNVEVAASIARERKPCIPTKGKWLPGKRPRESKCSSVLRCEPCKTDFSSKSSYKRHMNIHDLTAKNEKLAYQERPSRAKKLLAKAILRTTISNWKKKKPIGASEPSPSVENQSEKSKENFGPLLAKKVSSDDQNPYAVLGTACHSEKSLKMKCPVCRLSFGAAYLSNHFASLAHIHNELEYKEGSNGEAIEEQNKIVLANVSTMISICHFRCADCKFYCNLMGDFYRHVASHQQAQGPSNSFQVKYTCSACPEDGQIGHTEMLHHMITPAHAMACKDKILNAKIVVISSHSVIPCSLCDKSFKFYRQYEDHRRKHHRQSEFKLSTRTPRLCPLCKFQGHSCKEVRSHIRTSHDIMPHYVCYLCGTMHDTSEEAKTHRFSRGHRLKAGKEEDGAKHCRFCYTSFGSLQKLRKHLELEHQSHLTPCVKCAFIPVLQSDLRVHQKSCSGIVLEEHRNFDHRCELCPFSSRLAAFVMLHTTVIHGENALDNDTFICHVCQKPLKSTSLNRHMLFHTQEFPHRCGLCSRSFPVSDWLERHIDVAHSQADACAQTLLCQHCGLTFSSRTLLAQHLAVSTCNPAKKELLQKRIRSRTSQRFSRTAVPSSCDSAGLVCELCGEVCQTDWALKNHIRGHRSPSQLVHCPDCPYTTQNLAHLRRHRRTHTGVRPFRCPHCQYTANNQENLRRHMKTQKHPGRYLYECKFCQKELEPDLKKAANSEEVHSEGTRQKEAPQRALKRPSDAPPPGVFATDMAVRFRQHLEEKHLDQFDHMDEITRHVRSYYRPEEDVLACWETEASVQDEDEPEACGSLGSPAPQGRMADSTQPSPTRTTKRKKPPLPEKLRSRKVKKPSKSKLAKQIKRKKGTNVTVASSASEEITLSLASETQIAQAKPSEWTASVQSTQASQSCLRSESQAPISANESHVTHINAISSYSPGASTSVSNSLSCFVPQVRPILVQVSPTESTSRGPTDNPSSWGPRVGVPAQHSGSAVVLPTISCNPPLLQPSNPLPSGSLSSGSSSLCPLPSHSFASSDALSSQTLNPPSFMMTRFVSPQILPLPNPTGLPLCHPVLPIQLRHAMQPLLMTTSPLPKAGLPQIVRPTSSQMQPFSTAPVSVSFSTPQPPSNSYSTNNVFACPVPLVQPVVTPVIRQRFSGSAVNLNSLTNNFVPTSLVPPQTALLVRPLATSSESEASSAPPILPLDMSRTQALRKAISSPTASQSSLAFPPSDVGLPSRANEQPCLPSSGVHVHQNVPTSCSPDTENAFLTSTISRPKPDAHVGPSGKVDNSGSTASHKYFRATDGRDKSDFTASSAPPHRPTTPSAASTSTFTAVIPAIGSAPADGGSAISILCKKVRLPKRTN